MAEVSDLTKRNFQEKLALLHDKEKLYYTQEKKFLSDFTTHAQKSAKIQAAEARLNATSFLLAQNFLTVSLLGSKNERALNDARKSCYESIVYIEQVTNKYIDAPLSDYLAYQKDMKMFSDEDRYRIARKLMFSIEYLGMGYGENTKWRWSMVELFQRGIVVSRNLMNIEEMGSGFNPSKSGYQERVWHWQMVEEGFQKAASTFRNKYEITNRAITDIKVGIELLLALQKLCALIGKREDSEKIRRRVEIWRAKMENDLHRHRNV